MQSKLQLIQGSGGSRAMVGVMDYIALVAQLSGLHAIMLVALAARLLRIQRCDAECAKLEEHVRRLRALLQGPAAPTGRDVATAMAARALAEADGLVGSYRMSTLWCRVWEGRSMEARLRGMQDRVDFLCALVLGVHAILLAVHPASETNNATNHHVISDPLHGAETCDDGASHSHTYNGAGQGEADDHSDSTEPGGFESAV